MLTIAGTQLTFGKEQLFMKKLALLILAILPAYLNAQTDDFNDGTDQPEWRRYDPIGSHPQLPDIATFSFPNGNSYRIQTAPSPVPAQVGPGRAGSLRMDANYTDFYISVDIVNWNTNNNQAFGILARVNDIGLGATDGYAMTWDQGGRDLDISWFTNEAPSGVAVTGSDQAPLVLGRSYRMVFKGKGTQLTGEVYELPNLRTPLARITGTDDKIPSGVAGLIVYDNSSGATGPTDTTFDNYFALAEEPPRLEIDPQPFQEVMLSWSAEFPNHVLQYCTRLGAQWNDITDNIQEADGRKYYIEGGFEPTRFYRLRP